MSNLSFKISAGLKNIIGKELITNDLIAIFELVKNSYDANSKSVKIVFQNIKSPEKSRILIIDDGSGMSYSDLIDKFLFVGYSEKKESANKSHDYRSKLQKRRYFAGAKGIGRFSCDRLGSKLTLYTKKKEETNIHTLIIDWEAFEIDQKKEFKIIHPIYLETKKLELAEYPIIHFDYGTILEIQNLNDKWNWEKLLKLKRYLQRLINPVQFDKSQEFKIILESKEYLEEDKEYIKSNQKWNIINGEVNNFVFEDLGIKTTEINSQISDDGKIIHTSISDKGKFIFSLKEKNPFKLLKNINVKVFYLNQSAKHTFTRTVGIEPIRYGSIFLYKNGIRIHPYGDEDDDWLGLERRKTQGTKRFLSSREVMGRIEIYGEQDNFKEVSSRDSGIVKNEQYNELIEFFFKKIIRRLERYVVEGLDWDKEGVKKEEEQIKKDSIKIINQIAGKGEETEIKFNPKLLEIVKDKEIEKIPELIKNLESINKHIKDTKMKNYAEKQLKSFKSVTHRLETEIKETEKELVRKTKEVLFLSRSMSSDTEKITNFNHSIQDYSLSIEEKIVHINEILRNNNKNVDAIMEYLGEISKLNGIIKTLSEMISQANFDTSENELEKDIIEYIKQYLINIGTHKLQLRFHNDNLQFITSFKPLELGLILDNFRSNSRKANANQLHIKFEIENKNLNIYLADNGKGIQSVSKNSLFTRGNSSTGGSGLGLYNIKRMLSEIGAEIIFLGNNIENLGKGACFKVILNGK